MTNQQLHDGYHNDENPQALKDSYYDTLKKRASHGYSDAKKYVAMIEGGKTPE